MDLEIQDATDIAELTVLIEGHCMSQCANKETHKMKAAIDRIRERRASRSKRKRDGVANDDGNN
jgi:hypothetical protein